MADTLSKLSDKYAALLSKSKTAYSPGAEPTASDVNLQRSLYSAQKSEQSALNDYLKGQWYASSENDTVPVKKNESLIGKALDVLSTPLYAVTGAAEALLGKGRKQGLLENVADNIQEKNTFGDLIRAYGVDNKVAMPLGFAMDVALDPIGWVTGGASTLVGATARGALKAGAEGARLGAEANVLGKAAWAARTGEKIGTGVKDAAAVLLSDKNMASVAGKTANATDKYSSLTRNLTERANQTAENYNSLTGRTLENLTAKSEAAEGKRVFDKAYNSLQQSAFGRSVNNLFAYLNKKEVKGSLAAEDAARAVEASSGKVEGAIAKANREAEKILSDNGINEMDVFSGKQILNKQQKEVVDVATRMREEAENTVRLKKDIEEQMNRITGLFSADKASLAKLSGLSGKDKQQLAQLFRYYKADVDAYDKNVAKVLLTENGRKALSAYGGLIGWFKNSKIGGNVLGSASVNSVVGNLAMTSMMGMDIASGAFLKSMKNAANVVVRGKVSNLKDVLTDDEWMNLLKNYPETFEKTTGIRADSVLHARDLVDRLASEGIAAGKFSKTETAEVERIYDETFRDISASATLTRGVRSAAPVAMGGIERNMLAGEVLRGPYADWLEKLRVNGENGNRLASAVYKASTLSLETYGKFDQTYRLGTMLYLSKEGISLNELEKLARRTTVTMSDVHKTGSNRYVISPVKALEIAQETYMNYDAMPGFVRIMRTLPVLGSPFMAFSYGMMSNSAKTLLYNPQFYNKVSYLLHEIGGQKSPLEKEALNSKYYEWLQSPGMMKLPFFQQNPVYVNVANMLPHYTMNLLQSSERSYQSRYGNEVAGLIDKSPFFKTPEGSLLLDYIILPTLIADEIPQGQFGQQIWNKDATGLQKVGYAARTLGEAFMPTNVGYAGIGTAFGTFPEAALPYVPSYGFRKAGYASLGKNVQGISNSQTALERSAQVMSAMAGFPYYSVKLQYSNNKSNK